MTKSIEVSARTEDEAIESALEQLGLTRDDVSVEIVERAKTGFLGLKNTPAVVKVFYESEDDEPETARKTAPKAVQKETVKDRTKDVVKDTQKEESKGERTVRIEKFLLGLFERMDIEAGIAITEEDGAVNIILTSKDPGALIGRRGETLDAIQHLTNYVINRGASNRVRVNLDAENYRQRRNETLEQLAARTAGKVMKYRRNMTLDPMNAYERHVIHTALQDYENINTYSVGNEPNRRIVVAYGRGSKEGGGHSHADAPQYREWR